VQICSAITTSVRLPVVDDSGFLIGELSEQELMSLKEAASMPAAYVMLLDAVILSAQPPRLGQASATRSGQHGGDN